MQQLHVLHVTALPVHTPDSPKPSLAISEVALQFVQANLTACQLVSNSNPINKMSHTDMYLSPKVLASKLPSGADALPHSHLHPREGAGGQPGEHPPDHLPG